MEKLPSKSATTPLLVPTSTTDAPTSATPFSSETFPVIVCCPSAIEIAIKDIIILRISFFMFFKFELRI